MMIPFVVCTTPSRTMRNDPSLNSAGRLSYVAKPPPPIRYGENVTARPNKVSTPGIWTFRLALKFQTFGERLKTFVKPSTGVVIKKLSFEKPNGRRKRDYDASMRPPKTLCTG